MLINKINGLYGVTIDGDQDIEANVKAALDGGASVIQYRDKSSSDEKKLNTALRLKQLCVLVQYDLPLEEALLQF